MLWRASLQGTITASGFTSGDRIVVGDWRRSPIGDFTDVMWAAPDGRRRLIAPNSVVADFVTSIYEFDAVDVMPLDVARDAAILAVSGDDFSLRFALGRTLRMPVVRPAWFTRRIEGPVARMLPGVHLFGTSPTSVREWYRVDGLRRVRSAEALRNGVSLGDTRRVRPKTGFGFSEPPIFPASVLVRPLLEAEHSLVT